MYECVEPQIVIKQNGVEVFCKSCRPTTIKRLRTDVFTCRNNDTIQKIVANLHKWCDYYEEIRSHDPQSNHYFINTCQKLLKDPGRRISTGAVGEVAYKIMESHFRRNARFKSQEGKRLALICPEQCYTIMQTQSFRYGYMDVGMDILLANNVLRKPFSLKELCVQQLAKSHDKMKHFPEHILKYLLRNDNIARVEFHTKTRIESTFTFRRFPFKLLLLHALISQKMNGQMQCDWFSIQHLQNLQITCNCQFGFRSRMHALSKRQESTVWDLQEVLVDSDDEGNGSMIPQEYITTDESSDEEHRNYNWESDDGYRFPDERKRYRVVRHRRHVRRYRNDLGLNCLLCNAMRFTKIYDSCVIPRVGCHIY